MDKTKYIEDLKEIKEILSKTTRIVSLSGLSGVSTGIVALIGAYIAYNAVFKGQEYLVYDSVELPHTHLLQVLFIATSTIILSIWSAIFFTRRKLKSNHEKLWSIQEGRLIISMLIPLVTGGLLCLLMISHGFIGILPSITLIFYGLALVNSSKYTLPEIRNLGIIQIVLGLLAFQFIHFSLIIWSLGFGIIQIIYGLLVQKKY